MQQEKMTRTHRKREDPDVNSDAPMQSTEWQRRQDERDVEVYNTLDQIDDALTSFVLRHTVAV